MEGDTPRTHTLYITHILPLFSFPCISSPQVLCVLEGVDALLRIASSAYGGTSTVSDFDGLGVFQKENERASELRGSFEASGVFLFPFLSSHSSLGFVVPGAFFFTLFPSPDGKFPSPIPGFQDGKGSG